MSTSDIKTELRNLIENETDASILEAVKSLLISSNLNPILKKKLTSRALKSEQDIAMGRVMDRHELEQKLNARLGR